MQPKRSKPSRFPDTRWSLVGRATASDQTTRQQAMMELLETYSPVLRTFLVDVRHLSPDWADDLLQDFIADKILANKLVHRADQERGKFRNFVLKSLNHFVSAKLRKERALQDVTANLDQAILNTLASSSDKDYFEIQWVHQVVREALNLMEADCTARRRQDMWIIFRLRIVDPMLQGAEPVNYLQLIHELNLQSPRQAMNLLAIAKRAFDKCLRIAVGRYVHEDQVEAEITDLRQILTRS